MPFLSNPSVISPRPQPFTTRSQRKEAALTKLHRKDHKLHEQFLLVYPKWGKLPDFPGKGWAQHLPVGMFNNFPFPLFLDHVSHMSSSPLALQWG